MAHSRRTHHANGNATAGIRKRRSRQREKRRLNHSKQDSDADLDSEAESEDEEEDATCAVGEAGAAKNLLADFWSFLDHKTRSNLLISCRKMTI